MSTLPKITHERYRWRGQLSSNDVKGQGKRFECQSSKQNSNGQQCSLLADNIPSELKSKWYNYYLHNIVKTTPFKISETLKESDGARTKYLWNFVILLFKAAGKQYSFASGGTLCTTWCLTDPSRATFSWYRTVNLWGVRRAMEHNIKGTKELMYGQGANFSFPPAQMYSRESDDVKYIINNFHQKNKVLRIH